MKKIEVIIPDECSCFYTVSHTCKTTRFTGEMCKKNHTDKNIGPLSFEELVNAMQKALLHKTLDI